MEYKVWCCVFINKDWQIGVVWDESMLQDEPLQEHKQLQGGITSTGHICSTVLFRILEYPDFTLRPNDLLKLYTNPGKISLLSSHLFSRPLILLFISTSGSGAIFRPQIYHIPWNVRFSYLASGVPQGSALGPVLSVNHRSDFITWLGTEWVMTDNFPSLSFPPCARSLRRYQADSYAWI